MRPCPARRLLLAAALPLLLAACGAGAAGPDTTIAFDAPTYTVQRTKIKFLDDVWSVTLRTTGDAAGMQVRVVEPTGSLTVSPAAFEVQAAGAQVITLTAPPTTMPGRYAIRASALLRDGSTLVADTILEVQ
jgi:hypothetical protein